MKTFNNIKSNRQPSPDYINVTLHASIRGVYKHFHKCSMHQYNHVPSFKNPFEGKEQNMEKCWKWLNGVFYGEDGEKSREDWDNDGDDGEEEDDGIRKRESLCFNQLNHHTKSCSIKVS